MNYLISVTEGKYIEISGADQDCIQPMDAALDIVGVARVVPVLEVLENSSKHGDASIVLETAATPDADLFVAAAEFPTVRPDTAGALLLEGDDSSIKSGCAFLRWRVRTDSDFDGTLRFRVRGVLKELVSGWVAAPPSRQRALCIDDLPLDDRAAPGTGASGGRGDGSPRVAALRYDEWDPNVRSPGLRYDEWTPVRQHGGLRYDEWTPARQSAALRYDEWTPGRQHGGLRYDEWTPARQSAALRYDEWTPGRQPGGLRYDEWTPARQQGGLRYDEWTPARQSGGLRYDEWTPGRQHGGLRYDEWTPARQHGGLRYDEWTPGRRNSGLRYDEYNPNAIYGSRCD